MGRFAKVAISLPEDTLRVVDEKRKASGESRSQFFRRALENLVGQERAAVEEYIRGYRETPETVEEVEAVHKTGVTALAGEPWQ